MGERLGQTIRTLGFKFESGFEFSGLQSQLKSDQQSDPHDRCWQLIWRLEVNQH